MGKTRLKRIDSLEDLLPDEENANRGTDRGREAIDVSLRDLGAGRSVLVDRSGRLIAGNKATQAALRNLDPADIEVVRTDGKKLVVVQRTDLDLRKDTKARKLAFADNRTAELDLSWDPDALAAYSEDLDGLFTDAELRKLTNGHDDPLEDADPRTREAEQLREKWGTETGQIWQIGRHRLMCGDSTSPEDVEALLDGDSPFLTVTDPPYGVEYDPSWRRAVRDILPENTNYVPNDDRMDWTAAWKLCPGNVTYAWHADIYTAPLERHLEIAGFEKRAGIVWKKPRMVMSRGHYHWKHEPCIYAVRKGCGAGWAGDRKQATVWEIEAAAPDDTAFLVRPSTQDDVDGDRQMVLVDQRLREAIAQGDAERCLEILTDTEPGADGTTVWELDWDKPVPGGHATQKPIECMARPIRNHAGDVYDPFSGTGTTMAAAEGLGRTCYAMEVAPRFVAVILQRMDDLGHKGERIAA